MHEEGEALTQTTRYLTGEDLPGPDLPLSAEHRREILLDSAIDPEVARERGYQTVERPTINDQTPRELLQRKGFPGWAIRENYFYPGLWLPQYTPAGVQYAGQWKPKSAVPGRDGKPQRYASAKGPARLDVHPRWSRDRGGMQLPVIQDITERLWITEGVKKADSLTSRGCVTVALAGVYNWRSTHGTLGDWEDVRIKGREVVICFDADAITKPAVATAMARLGKWLRHRGAVKVWYLTVPPMVEGSAVKGVDDYFAAGGTLKALEQAMRTSPPQVTETEDRFTDARLAETLANDALESRYIWVPGLDWLRFDAVVWKPVHDVEVGEEVRQWTLQQFAEAAARLKLDGSAGEVDGWRGTLSSAKADAILKRSRGIMIHQPDELDVDVDHINTPSGYLPLEGGDLRPLGEGDYPTRITGARFDPEATSEVWDQFLNRVLPDLEVQRFVQRLIGYSMLGEVREHKMPIFTGEGRNGKGTLRDAVLAAFGSYGLEVDPELLMTRHNPRHATFLMELMGRRLVFCSETNKDRCFNESEMKRLVGGDPIQANRMKCDPITFKPSHTLIMCTNHLPKVSGDDPATWARILVVPFDVVIPPEEQDPRLPGRLQEEDVRAAVLAWAYAGLQEYLRTGLNPPEAVVVRTERYRADSDVLGRFLAERVEAVPAGRVKAAELYATYLVWHRSEGGHDDPLPKREFGQAMAQRGFPSVKVAGSMIYRGLRLVAETPDDLG